VPLLNGRPYKGCWVEKGVPSPLDPGTFDRLSAIRDRLTARPLPIWPEKRLCSGSMWSAPSADTPPGLRFAARYTFFFSLARAFLGRCSFASAYALYSSAQILRWLLHPSFSVTLVCISVDLVFRDFPSFEPSRSLQTAPPSLFFELFSP